MPSGSDTLKVQQLTVGPLEENCWLLADPASGKAVLVDPGDEVERLLAAVDATGCTLEAIWLTHAHFDHVGAVAPLLRERPVPVWLHPLDLPLYGNAATSAARWGISIETPTGATEPLAEGSVVSLGRFQFEVWHVPGHAPGHVAFLGHGLCISGDLVFAGSIGRTDLPLCDPRAMQASLMRITTLDDGTRVLPGHGVTTTIGQERLSNPFLRGAARPIGA
ncbi:hydrolase [Gemmatimonas aurantiaca T-27]|uniref:Hydrolase n=1 Tax=Gemmatimonas aurantiaca (strain DSM 14586 / JCM 11422 / NBRC 100505 / T-27) TaxID=379066 RepID=C1A4K3_GEMAT|nr:MBL fold metallo-hydrolase [Gemmatimonas aurantiaca]BAH39028.1 hydrolase [Gemmatimonas aurantiaca T-27]